MTIDPDMDARAVFAVESGMWTKWVGVLYDGGSFPMSRIPHIAHLVDKVLVVSDKGAIAALREAGVGEVVAADGDDLADALQLTSEAHAPVVFAGVPKKPGEAVLSAIGSMADAGGTQLPVAAVMFMRDDVPEPGSTLCTLVERTFVSGYTALFSIMLSSKTGGPVHVVGPRAKSVHTTHSEILQTALDLAHRSGTKFEVTTDPAPRAWAIDHSRGLGAIFCGILQANTTGKEDGSKVERVAGPDAETASLLLKQADCDVVMVMDRVSLRYGTTAGAQVAKAVGAAMGVAIAVTGAATPAVAAVRPPSVTRQVAAGSRSAKGVGELLGTSASIAVAAGSEGSADGASGQADSRAAASAEEASTDEVATDESATDESATDELATDEAATDGATTDEAATDGATTDEPATDGATTDEPATDGATTGDEAEAGALDEGDMETPQQWIAFRVWTDSQGRNHVVSSGLQDQPVDTPALPDWAVADGGDHPQLARTNPGYVSPDSLAATPTRATTHKRHKARNTHKQRAVKHKRQTAKHKRAVAKHKRAAAKRRSQGSTGQ